MSVAILRLPRPGGLCLSLALLASTLAPLSGQVVRVQRPVPGPVVPPPGYRAALEAGTRSLDGSPGPSYWQNRTAYRIEARLEPGSGLLEATGRVTLENRSPVALDQVVMYLHQNLHAPGAVRNEPAEVTGGLRIGRLVVDGEAVEEVQGWRGGPGYRVDGALLRLVPPRPVAPGSSVTVEIDWAFTVPGNGAGRMGHSDREMYFLAYWFPKVAVFDDLRGWDAEPYLGAAEFYDEFGDYDVTLVVPDGWTVMATGSLENPEEVYGAEVLARLGAAREADTMVVVVDGPRRRGATRPGPDGRLRYRFSALDVRDFTWTASRVQTWVATSARVPDRDGDGREDRVAIHSFFRSDRAPLWREQALYGKHAIEHHSRYTGFPYPWPHMTSVEGDDIIGGGMEFPMLTLIGPYRGRRPEDLYNVTSHELAHMWIPMIVGSNERRHAWMDEGATTFLENVGRPDYWPDTPDPDSLEALGYLGTARGERELPMMTHGDYYEPGPGYGVASYSKPATLMVTLGNLLGRETLESAYRAFIREWAFRHPTPWDFFRTVERFAGQDLDWFWSAWYYETWTLDQAVGAVTVRDGLPVIRVEDRGFAPMPVRLRIETQDAGTLERTVPVDPWLRGETAVEVTLPASVGEILRVEIDPERDFPDVDRSNNRWERRVVSEEP